MRRARPKNGLGVFFANIGKTNTPDEPETFRDDRQPLSLYQPARHFGDANRRGKIAVFVG